MKKTSKIYIAGHTGLVGSALVRRLHDSGYGNLVTRSRSELDLTDQSAVREFFAKEQPEYVFLAAAKVGGIAANNRFRAEFIHTNLMIQSNVIHQSYAAGVEKLLFLGSTCIYPKNAPQPMPEDCLLTSPLEYTNEPYAVAKIAGLKMCESYNLQYGTNFIAAMPTNLYGPEDNFDLETSHVLPALLRKIYLARLLHEGRTAAVLRDLGVSDEHRTQEILNRFNIGADSVEIWGSGRPQREFLFVDDLADACLFLMNNVDFPQLAEMCQGEVRNTHVNIGTGSDLSIRALAETIRDVVGYSGRLEFNPDRPDGTFRKLTDVTRLHHLGWHHQTDLRTGLRKTFDWYTDTAAARS